MAIKNLAAEAPPAPSAPPAMEIDAKPVWSPSPGMAISTVHVTRTQHAYVAVEHPGGMTRAAVLAELKNRALDFGPKVGWWECETQTEWAEIALDSNAPHDTTAEPFPLVVGAPAGE